MLFLIHKNYTNGTTVMALHNYIYDVELTLQNKPIKNNAQEKNNKEI